MTQLSCYVKPDDGRMSFRLWMSRHIQKIHTPNTELSEDTGNGAITEGDKEASSASAR